MDLDAQGTLKNRFHHLRSLIKSNKLAYQGIAGAYSHQACKQAFPKMNSISYPSFEAAFEAAYKGDVDFAMIPIENSLGGRVADIHHLLPNSSLYIVGEFFLPIHHCLLGPKGSTLESIKKVRSHPQALAQCRKTLRALDMVPETFVDTAAAAKEISEMKNITVGAIASSIAAKTYNLMILRNHLEDRIGNVTRFIILSRYNIAPDMDQKEALQTSLLFTTRSVSAALYKCLGGFASNGVNFIKLESYIGFTGDKTAQFYAEVEGSPDQKNMDKALEELQFFTTKLKIVGTYAQSPFRHEG